MYNAEQQSTWDMPFVIARVARRALIMAAVVCRGSLESYADQPDAEPLHARILEWLNQTDLWKEAEPSEENLLHASLGNLHQEEVIRATWYVEGLAILAWALKQREFPRHDQQVDPPEVAESVGLLSGEA